MFHLMNNLLREQDLAYAVEVFDSRECLVGEGPVWDQEHRRVVWVDVLGSRILWRNFDGSGIGVISTPSHVGAVLPTSDQRWIVCLRDGIFLTSLEQQDYVEVIKFPLIFASDGTSPVAMRANDAKVDPSGIIYCGVIPYDTVINSSRGALYALSRDGLVTAISGTTLSNGIGWSPDGHTMYFVDSALGRVDKFSFNQYPDATTRSVFATFEQSECLPDGLAVDSEGNVWVALWGGGCVLGFDSSGQSIGKINIPAVLVTSCAFAGDDLTKMIVTSSRLDLANGEVGGMTYLVSMPLAGVPQTLAQVGELQSRDTFDLRS